MAYDGQYKVITGYDLKSKRNSPEWTIYSKQVQGIPPIVFDLKEDQQETKDLSANMPAQAHRLLQILQANAAA